MADNNNLLMAESTQKAFTQLLGSHTHAVLFSGPLGSGKSYLAKHYAAERLDISIEELNLYPYFLTISAQGSVGIAQIRDLQKFMLRKTTGNKNQTRRVAIIESAHTMTTEAQNALLKLLEEPPADSLIILTSADNRSLRPTILSRVHSIRVLPISEEVALAFFQSYDEKKVKRAWQLSSGSVGLLTLLMQEESHSLIDAVEQAKILISSTYFERLSQVDALSKQKEQLAELLFATKLICQAGIKVGGKGTKRWQHALKAVLEAEKAFSSNANTKLLLTNLFLDL